jgi:nitroreductase
METIEKVDLIEKLEKRYATKKFDATKKLSKEQIFNILTAMNLSASSYGLQPYRFILVENPEVREKLKAASWGQSQITDASHLIVIARLTNVNEAHVDEFVENISSIRGVERGHLAQYEGVMKNTVNTLSKEAAAVWTSKQAYIALGNLLAYCASEDIDACPMEGFDANQYDEILGLNEKNLTALVVAPIGYRSVEDEYQHAKKVRKPLSEMVIRM